MNSVRWRGGFFRCRQNDLSEQGVQDLNPILNPPTLDFGFKGCVSRVRAGEGVNHIPLGTLSIPAPRVRPIHDEKPPNYPVST